MNNWVELNEENLPDPHLLVWCERGNGSVYLASRNDAPLSKNMDASRDCCWWGNPLHSALTTSAGGEMKARHNFSDVTVKRWHHVQIPPKQNAQS